MKKIIFAGLVAVSTMFGADSAKDLDILAQATTTKVDGTKLALAKSEAEDVKAGWYRSYTIYYPRFNFYTRAYSYGYRNSYYGSYYTRYYNSGRRYSWSTFNRGGYTWMRYGYGSR